MEPAAATPVTITMRMDAMRSDLVRGLVWFVNYAALDPTAVRVDQLDLHGTGMLPVDVELFAHRWMGFSRTVDMHHDGVGRPVVPVESFFNGPDIASQAFPINCHATRLDASRSKEAIDGLRNGSLNSISLDALTFNKVVRLPVAANRNVPAQSVRSQPSQPLQPIPHSLSDWALEIAQCGYEGVVGVRELDPGLFIAMRSSGLPLAVHIDGDDIEVESSTGGPWGRIAAALYRSPTLTKMSSYIPVDHTPWTDESVQELMKWIGLTPAGELERVGPMESEAFAAVDEATMRGYLPHHTVRGGVLMTSRDAVRRAMSSLDAVPAHLRAGAEAHLRAHVEAP